MQLYNLEGEPMETVPDGSPVPSGRFASPEEAGLASGRLIQLFDMEGVAREVVPSGGSIPSGRWTSPMGGQGQTGGTTPPGTPGVSVPITGTGSGGTWDLSGGGTFIDGAGGAGGGGGTTTPPPRTTTPPLGGTGTGFTDLVGSGSGGGASALPTQDMNYWMSGYQNYKVANPNATFDDFVGQFGITRQGFNGQYSHNGVPLTGPGWPGPVVTGGTINQVDANGNPVTPPAGGYQPPPPGTVPTTGIGGTTTQPPTIGGGTTTQPPAGPTFGGVPINNGATSLTYSQLLDLYRTEHGGQDPASGNVFNEWVGEKGISQWAEDPDGGVGAAGNNYIQNQTSGQAGQFSTQGKQTTQQNQTSGTTNQQNTNQITNQVGTTQNNQTIDQAGLQTTNQTQNQTGQTTNNQTSTGTGSQTGVTTGTQTGTTQQVGEVAGTTRTTPIDTLGFGSLLQTGRQRAEQADMTRQNYLSDLVTTGGKSYQSQMDQAIRNSMTGPAMTGAGDSARARAAGYAGAQVARHNTGDRLAAAQQLAGPTASQQLAAAGTPFMGSTSSNTATNKNTGVSSLSNEQVQNLSNSFNNLVSGIGTSIGSTQTAGTVGTTGRTNTSGTTGTQGSTSTAGSTSGSTTGFQDLTGTSTEGQTGTASGTGSQSAKGLIPQAQTVNTGGGGGCIICTAGIHHNLWRRKRLLKRVVSHKLHPAWPRFRYAARGYFFLFTPLARACMKHAWLSRLTMPYANLTVYEEARLAGVRRLPFKVGPWLAHWAWHGVCTTVGHFLPKKWEDVTDHSIRTVAKRHGVLFQHGE